MTEGLANLLPTSFLFQSDVKIIKSNTKRTSLSVTFNLHINP